MASRISIVEQVEQIAQRVAAGKGLEIVEVQLLGGGGHRMLRIFIDRVPGTNRLPAADRLDGETAGEAQAASADPGQLPEGVTLGDCEYISQQVGTILDVEDVIPGGKYTLEVSSPGVERRLSRPHEFARFVGQKIKVKLHDPVESQKTWTGLLRNFEEGVITLEPKPGKSLQFPLEQVQQANLKFEW